MSTDVIVAKNPERLRFEATLDGSLAGFVEFQETAELVVVTHTEVDRTFEGRGVGSALARAVLDDVRARHLKALVVCPFVNGWLRNHPDYRDLVYNAPPSAVND